jgi:hypothetical protein
VSTGDGGNGVHQLQLSQGLLLQVNRVAVVALQEQDTVRLALWALPLPGPAVVVLATRSPITTTAATTTTAAATTTTIAIAIVVATRIAIAAVVTPSEAKVSVSSPCCGSCSVQRSNVNNSHQVVNGLCNLQ